MFFDEVVKCNEEELDCFANSDPSCVYYIYYSNKFIPVCDGVYFLSFTKISNYRLKKMFPTVGGVRQNEDVFLF